MKWLIEILKAHNRMRGLTEHELQDLIRTADSPEALQMIKEHLLSKNFRFAHIEMKVPALLEQCKERAKEIIWSENAHHARDIFFERLGDFF